ncbi:MAG: type II toxin-antitoxin system VapC family toxin [Syntrophothermus sp.]
MNVLWDTSGVVAFLRADDPHHAEAAACVKRLEGVGGRLMITNFIVSEVYALLLSRASPHIARRWLRENPLIPQRVTETDEARARAILFSYTDKDFSYVDATSFAVMERLGIDTAFTFDLHFKQYGWKQLTSRLN